MDSLLELSKAVAQGDAVFKQYVQEQITVNPDFLEHFFWNNDASQMTVLNYLIHLYCESESIDSNPLVPMIDYVLNLMKNKNIGAPLHQAISMGKINLAFHLLKQTAKVDPFPFEEKAFPGVARAKKTLSKFNINERDDKGRTLLFLVLTTKNDELLAALLTKKPRIHDVFYINNTGILFQALHQAVILNYPQGIRLLAQHGAQLSNPCGQAKHTPVLLAAHLCNIAALETLLEQSVKELSLEAECYVEEEEEDHLHTKTAIEVLCSHLDQGKKSKEALSGIAMLLCRGAKPPRSESMRQLLSNHRDELLKVIHQYLEDKPELVDDFVQRCHSTESALHNILYAPHSWNNNLRHLFGIPSTIAVRVEQLVIRKYTTSATASEPLPTAAAAVLSLDTEPLKLYAMFVKRYTETYNNQLFANPWSKMRFLIADGQGDWEKVQRYVEANPLSRSAAIYKEMLEPLPELHSVKP